MSIIVHEHQSKRLQQPFSWQTHRREMGLPFTLKQLLPQGGKLSSLAVAVSGQLCAQSHPWCLSPCLPLGLESTKHLNQVPAKGEIIQVRKQRCLKKSQEEGGGVPNAPPCWRPAGKFTKPFTTLKMCQFLHKILSHPEILKQRSVTFIVKKGGIVQKVQKTKPKPKQPRETLGCCTSYRAIYFLEKWWGSPWEAQASPEKMNGEKHSLFPAGMPYSWPQKPIK